MNYGARLRQARTLKGWTQGQLSEAAGVSQATISKIERGDQDLSIHDPELCDALGIRVRWLRYGDEPMDQEHPSVAERGAEYVTGVPVTIRVAPAEDGSWPVTAELAADVTVRWTPTSADAFGVWIEGDNLGPRFQHGEILIVEPSIAAEPGEEVLVELSDGIRRPLLWLYSREGRYYMQAIGPSMEQVSFGRQEVKKLDLIAGVARSRQIINKE